MKLTNLSTDNDLRFKELSINCQQFIEESDGLPLIKWCSSEYPDIHRVKVRKKKSSNLFECAFNDVFHEEYPSIRQRSIIVNNQKNKNSESFYVFPADGYKFLYSSSVFNSAEQYESTYSDITNSLSQDVGNDVFKDMIDYSYKSDNIKKAISEKVEIIIYNIPFFYVVRCKIEYNKLLEFIN